MKQCAMNLPRCHLHGVGFVGCIGMRMTARLGGNPPGASAPADRLAGFTEGR